jgi:DNA-binding GntR family transcriptional regulator
MTEVDDRPLRDQVADKLRALIDSGDLGPGDRLDPEAELAERYGVGRTTMRAALDDLAAEGLLSSGRGRGRQVRSYRPLEWRLSDYESRHRHETVGDQGDQWAAGVRAQGREPDEQLEQVAIVEPPPHVAELLGVGPDDLVLVRRRVRLVDGTPFQLSSSYFREALAHGTPLMSPRPVSAPGGILASLGHFQVRYEDRIQVRPPTKDEADKLGLPKGTAVAEVTRTGYDKEGVALRCMVTVVPGDRHILIYSVDPE